MTGDLRWLARVIVTVSAIHSTTDVVPRQVPFLSVLSSVGPDRVWLALLHSGVIVGSVLVFTSLWRFGSFIVGSSWVAAVLGNMPLFSNGRLLQGLVLVLCGLAVTEFGMHLVRAQMIILYAGAALSKTIDPDWWNGRFIATLWEFHQGVRPGLSLMWLAQTVGILTIVIEGAIAVTLSLPHTRNIGVVLSATFHALTVVFLSEDFGMFSYTVVLVTIALFATPSMMSIGRGRYAKLSAMTTVYELRPSSFRTAPLGVTVGKRALPAPIAFALLTLATAPGQVALFGFAAGMSRVGLPHVRDTVFGLFIVLVIVVALALWPDSTGKDT
jgi:Vitamin K-dependent gamma-carboxylase